MRLWGKILFQHRTLPPYTTATHPPNQIFTCNALLLISLLCFFCSSLSATHTPSVPRAFLFTLTHMHAFTFGYFVCTLLYFFLSFPFYSSLSDSWRYSICAHTAYKQKHTQGLYLMLYITDVWAAAIWGPKWEQKASVRVCVSVCSCGVGLRAKLKVGVWGLGLVVKTPSRELGLSGESGKNIPTVINQNFSDTNDQKQRTVLHPCQCVTSAQQPCPTHLRHNPIGPRRTPTNTIGLLVPGRNRDPVLANWAFVIAQSVVALWENETWKRYYGGWRKTGRLKRGDRFWRHKAPDALPESIMMPYRGSRWFRRSNCEDTKQDGDRPKMETHTNTYMQMQPHTHSHIQSLI